MPAGKEIAMRWQGLFYSFVGCDHPTQSSALNFEKKIFPLEMIKNDICLGMQANKMPFFWKSGPTKNAPMPLMSRIGPGWVLRNIETHGQTFKRISLLTNVVVANKIMGLRLEIPQYSDDNFVVISRDSFPCYINIFAADFVK